jgi:CheY-like chemotaxis protein
MQTRKVLWIEDNADNDLYHLTSPVYIDGSFQLDIATNASEAFYYLNKRGYDVIIVDIRIPPGKDPQWQSRHDRLMRNKHTNSNRLGLELLRSIFDENEEQPSLQIDQNMKPERYGVFTVERHEELESDLLRLNLDTLKYRRKNAMMPHTALLDFIKEVSELNGGANGHY